MEKHRFHATTTPDTHTETIIITFFFFSVSPQRRARPSTTQIDRDESNVSRESVIVDGQTRNFMSRLMIDTIQFERTLIATQSSIRLLHGLPSCTSLAWNGHWRHRSSSLLFIKSICQTCSVFVSRRYLVGWIKVTKSDEFPTLVGGPWYTHKKEILKFDKRIRIDCKVLFWPSINS